MAPKTRGTGFVETGNYEQAAQTALKKTDKSKRTRTTQTTLKKTTDKSAHSTEFAESEIGFDVSVTINGKTVRTVATKTAKLMRASQQKFVRKELKFAQASNKKVENTARASSQMVQQNE